MKKKYFLLFCVLFAVSRIFVFLNPPPYYSDVTADYERYANIWRYSLTPYLEHLYEYPPASIPLLSFPLTLDQAGIGKYYANYRMQILVIDALFFLVVLSFLSKRKLSQAAVGIVSYIALTTVAKDFLYEGLDLAFSASFVLAVLILSKQKENSLWELILAWTLFWLSTAIKFLTFPLLIPLFLASNWKKINRRSIVVVIATFILVWGVPLFIYRSSLSVSFVHNFARPIKYASFPAHIIRWIDTFTKSEQQNMIAPDFEYVGPVSLGVTNANRLIFPLAIFGFLVWSVVAFLRQKEKHLSAKRSYLIATYLTYVFVLFLTAKTFSQPFHIWYLVALPLISFTKSKLSIAVLSSMLLLVLLDTTGLLAVHSNYKFFSVIPLSLVRDSFRFLPMFFLLLYFHRYHEPQK